MLKLLAKLTSYDVLKTQINVTFAVKHFDDETDLYLTQLQGTDGYLIFDGKEIKLAVEEAMKAKDIGIDEDGKSPSQRLRGALFQYWNDCYDGKETFEEYYLRAMNFEINKVKASRNEKLQQHSDGNAG